jgi:hypothetical protein
MVHPLRADCSEKREKEKKKHNGNSGHYVLPAMPKGIEIC